MRRYSAKCAIALVDMLFGTILAVLDLDVEAWPATRITFYGPS
ncbi:hypothetical protein [Paraburkholderia ribeironis]|nr:hypothetical protein [Paraburkholderia ribeironis]